MWQFQVIPRSNINCLRNCFQIIQSDIVKTITIEDKLFSEKCLSNCAFFWPFRPLFLVNNCHHSVCVSWIVLLCFGGSCSFCHSFLRWTRRRYPFRDSPPALHWGILCGLPGSTIVDGIRFRNTGSSESIDGWCSCLGWWDMGPMATGSTEQRLQSSNQHQMPTSCWTTCNLSLAIPNSSYGSSRFRYCRSTAYCRSE